jgi:Terminase RNaseH-like domain
VHLTEWWEEFRLYHRKDGKVHKEHDDLLSATRYGVMMLRYAENLIPQSRATSTSPVAAIGWRREAARWSAERSAKNKARSSVQLFGASGANGS